MEAKLIREMVEAYASVYDQDLNEMMMPSPLPSKDPAKMQKPKPLKPSVKGPIGRGPSGKPVKNGGSMGEQSVFDIIKGHLLDEGYADTEDAALAIMANMSQEWKQSILIDEELPDRVTGKKELIGGPRGYIKVGGPTGKGDVRVSGVGPVGTYARAKPQQNNNKNNGVQKNAMTADGKPRKY